MNVWVRRDILTRAGERWWRVSAADGFGAHKILEIAGDSMSGGVTSRSRADAILPAVIPVELQRFDLPKVSAREAVSVARRKRDEAAAAVGDGHTIGFHAASSGGDSALWIFEVATPDVEAFDRTMCERKLEVDRIVPHALAVGATPQLLPPISEPCEAVLWIEPDYAHCVITDALGWRFGRDIQLPAEGALEPEKPLEESDRPLSGPADLELVGNDCVIVPDRATDIDSNALGWQLDCVATELQRTLVYVDRSLDIGAIGRLVVCGESERASAAADHLIARFPFPVVLAGSPEAPLAGNEVPPEVAAASGASTFPRKTRLANALPSALAAPRCAVRCGHHLRSAAIALVLLTATLGLVRGFDFAAAQSEHAQLVLEQLAQSARADSLKTRVEERRRLSGLEAFHAHLAEPGPPWALLISAMGAVAPDDVYLDSLEAHADEGAWRFRARAIIETSDTVHAALTIQEFVEALNATGLARVDSAKRSAAVRPVVLRDGRAYQLEGWLATPVPDEAGGGVS